MTDQDESRPLSRREIRLREMAAAGVAPEETPAPQDATAVTEEAGAAAAASVEIDIPLFDETGRQRSRRELRELRDQALAAQAAAQQEAEIAAEPEVVLPEVEPAPAEPVAPEADELAAPEAEPVQAESVQAEPVAEPDEAQPEAESALAESEQVLPETVAFDVIADQQPEPASDFASLLHEIATESAPAAGLEAEPEADPEPVAQAQAESVPEPETVAGAEAEQAALGGFAAPVSAASSQGYSFPDIAPLDEGHSIFDDPALRMMSAQGTQSVPEDVATGGGRDFDDLITRAVAQEGAASTTNTSALILPTMPETEGLTGPLGETGELFVTGSFELPKSLSETGGHSALHDSVDADPLDDLGFSEATPTGMMAPVSASRAVSARSEQGSLVTEATKDKSKMPVVLIATGGVLVLGAAGLIVWAAASGLFG